MIFIYKIIFFKFLKNFVKNIFQKKKKKKPKRSQICSTGTHRLDEIKVKFDAQ